MVQPFLIIKITIIRMSNPINAQTLSFKVHSFKNNNAPDKDLNYYTLFVDITDMPFKLDEWREVNVRDPKEGSRPFKEMKNTLATRPEMFLFNNRGITLIAEELSFDNKTNLAYMRLSNKKYHGLLDGGHTFRAIKQHLEENPDHEPGSSYVKLEVITGPDTLNFKQDIVEIVGARNTSIQVQNQSLIELEGSFGPIKEVLQDKHYADCIAYKENEDGEKPIDIKEILSYLICFDKINYTSSGEQPTIAYSGKATVVKKYSKESTRNEIYKNVALLPDILWLHDVLYKRIPEEWNKMDGKFGLLKFVNTKKSTPLYYIGGKLEGYNYSKALLYPILAAFRANVEDGNNGWKVPMRTLLEDDLLLHQLVVTIKEAAAGYNNDPQKIGKEKFVWRSCYNVAQLHIQHKTAMERFSLQ